MEHWHVVTKFDACGCALADWHYARRAPAKGPHWSVTMSGSSVQDCSVSRTLAEARAPSGDVRVMAVVGSRPPKWDAPDEAQDAYVARKQAIRAFVKDLPAGTTLVSGGARGVDTTAERAAICRRPIRSYRPEKQSDRTWRVRLVVFDARGNVVSQELLPPIFPRFAAAAFWRNGEMVRVADRVAAFHDGVSRGTADTIRKAKAAGKLIP